MGDHYEEWARSQALKGRSAPETTAPYSPPRVVGSIDPETMIMTDLEGNQKPVRFCIDADCPKCGWPERWFDGKKFGCNKCEYTSTERNK